MHHHHEKTGHRRWVWDADFSADSSFLVTSSSDHSAKLWNVRRKKNERIAKNKLNVSHVPIVNMSSVEQNG